MQTVQLEDLLQLSIERQNDKVGQDILEEERRKIRDLSNVYQDAKSSERVGKFIIDLLNE